MFADWREKMSIERAGDVFYPAEFVVRRSRLDALTGLRGMAALAVFFVHFQARLSGDPARLLAPMAAAGGMGVTFFFVLSGFILTWSFRPGDTRVAFWRRRFARIYPAYFVALVGGVALTIAAHNHSGVSPVQRFDSPEDLIGPILSQLFLVQSWIPNAKYYFSLNGVGWSLSCEAFFYLLFPLFLPLVLRARKRARRVAQVVLFVVIVIAALLSQLKAFPEASWVENHLPAVTAAQFVLGSLLAADVLCGDWRKLLPAPSLIALACVYLFCGLLPTEFGTAALPIVPIMMVIAAYAHAGADGRPSVFTSRPLVWLGEVSYCFYLVHQLAVRVLGVLGGADDWLSALAQLVAALVMGLLAAWGLHRIIEQPFEQKLRGRSRAVRPVTLK